MKLCTLLLASLLAPMAALAEPQAGAQSNVTLNLVRHDSVQVSAEGANPFVTKLVKYRYGSRDLLANLLAEGLLGEGEVLKGWKLVLVDRSPLVESEVNTLVFYAIKAGKTPVQIPFSRLGLDTESEIGVDGITEKTEEGVTVSLKSSFKAVVGLSGSQQLESENDTYDSSFELIALASGSDAWKVRTIKDTEGVASTDTYNLLGKISLSPVLGWQIDHLADDARTPIEGSITFSAFVPLDISAYPFTPPEIL